MMGDVLDLSLFALPNVGIPMVDQRSSSVAPKALLKNPVDQRITDDEFLAGPIRMGWLEAAARLPGAALPVALLVRHLHVLRGRDWVVLSNIAVKKFGLTSSAKARAVVALENAGLIMVVRQKGCAPRVKPVGDR